MHEPPARTLTVACTAGLSNRLRVLLSGLALSGATGRRLEMLWPPTPACAATFGELFATTLPVQDVAESEWSHVQDTFERPTVTRDLLVAEEAILRLWTSGYLVYPARFPSHRSLWRQMGDLLAAMQPADDIMARITAFHTQAFRPKMIGVHLRRGDMRYLYPLAAANTLSAMQAVDTYLSQCPAAGILLCTDDGAPHQHTGQPLPVEGVRAQFLRRYGTRVVSTTPRSLDRREAMAIQDAVVDLWLLRKTDYFVGTAGSSFSDMVALGRAVPVSLCRLQHPLRHLLALRIWLRGERPLRWLARYYWHLIRPRGAR